MDKGSTERIKEKKAAREIPQIQPATGALGVLLPGMGATTTMLIAGVEAVKRGMTKPIGSLTQIGTVRLGKRTDNRSPKIQEFVPLAAAPGLYPEHDIFIQLMQLKNTSRWMGVRS